MCAVGAAASDPLPLPIGPLSDYGAVLDRHGREEIGELIDQALVRTGLEVHILATWENPLSDTRTLAETLLSTWKLSQRNAILAVFVRTATGWSAAVAVTDRVRASRGNIDRDLERRIADLVRHDRIKEAMFELLDGLSSSAPKAASPAGASKTRGISPAVSIPAVVGGIALLAVWVHRRVCPRCGAILRMQHTRTLARPIRRVYSCPRCGFRRER
jgi:predicted RNA-binding Zn-ribbon protein involved in translation (DUF1610 family)